MLRFLLKLLKILLTLVLIAVLGVAGLFGYLTLTEYKPADVEWQTPLCEDDTAPVVEDGATLKILSWNIGYAGLGAGSDFYMDGGKDTASADNATVNKYLDGIMLTRKAAADQATTVADLSSERTDAWIPVFLVIWYRSILRPSAGSGRQFLPHLFHR